MGKQETSGLFERVAIARAGESSAAFLARMDQEKAKRRAGRPKASNVSREPSGRISRAKEPADMVALKARAKHMGITMEQARDEKAADFIGVLVIMGRESGLTKGQFGAIDQYRHLRRQSKLALKSPDSMASGGRSGGNGETTEEYVEWAQTAVERYEAARKAILEEQWAQRTENLLGALDICIHRGERQDHMIGSVRLIANALMRHFQRADR